MESRIKEITDLLTGAHEATDRLQVLLHDFSGTSDKSIEAAKLLRQSTAFLTAAHHIFNENDHWSLPVLISVFFEGIKSYNAELQLTALTATTPLISWLFRRDASKKTLAIVSAFLLAVYNTEITDAKGAKVTRVFAMPTLSTPSVYHKPKESATVPTLTANALQKHETANKPVATHEEYPTVNQITPANFDTVVAIVLRAYEAHVRVFPPIARAYLCETLLRLVQSGYQFPSIIPQVALLARAHLDEQALSTIAQIGFVCAFQANHGPEAKALLSAVHDRARYDLNPKVLLFTKAAMEEITHKRSLFSEGK